MHHPDWTALRRSLAGTVILPADPGYDEARALQIASFDGVRPRAVVRCRTTEDVSATVRFARAAGLPVTPRGGGHSLAGHSTGTGVVIDTRGLDGVTVEDDGLVRVGGGTQALALHTALRGHGVTLPTGLCPTVGITGLTMGGGVGLWTRKYGMTCDRLRAARLVLADGSVVDCDENRHPDLFWAVRGGGGGNFGVVTSLLFEPVPSGDITSYLVTWPWEAAARVLECWQHWAPHAPDELTSGLRIALDDAGGGQRASVSVSGGWLGPESGLRPLLEELSARVGVRPEGTVVRTASHWDTMATVFGLPEGEVPGPADGAGHQVPVPRDGFVLTRGHFVERPLPAEGVDRLLAAFDDDRQPGQVRALDLGAMGGAANRVAADATAFVHRDALFFGGFTAEDSVGLAREARASARRWAAAGRAALLPWSSGRSYQNSPDPELPDWRAAYYGDNHARLLEVRETYDPGRFFRFAQSI